MLIGSPTRDAMREALLGENLGCAAADHAETEYCDIYHNNRSLCFSSVNAR